MPVRALDAQPGSLWVDSTAYLGEVCDDMKTGELLHGENFSLFDSMSAVEIGDPKMDAGLNADATPSSVNELIALGRAPLDLSPEQLLDVMDELVAAEGTWQEGHSLAQTVFTCLYMHDPERTKGNELLSVFCRSVRAMCHHICGLSSRANVHEEEDFNPYGYRFDLDGAGGEGKSPAERAVSAINQLEELLGRLLKLAKEGGGGGRPEGIGASLQRMLDEAGGAEGERAFLEALLPRFRLRRLLLQALLAMDKAEGRGLEAAHKHLVQAKEQLAAVQGTVGEAPRAAPVPGFDQLVNRKLLAPAPPRAVVALTPLQALGAVGELAGQLQRLCSLGGGGGQAGEGGTPCPPSRTLEELGVFLEDLNRSMRPCPVARARLALLLLPAGSVSEQHPEAGALSWAPLRPLVRAAIGLPPAAAVPPTHAAHRPTERFIDRAVELTLAGLRIQCNNPSRQRRKTRRLLEDWAAAYREATEVEGSPAWQALWEEDFPEDLYGFGAPRLWVHESTTRCVLSHLCSGFELDLYPPREFVMMYWYVDYLLALLASCLTWRAKRHIDEKERERERERGAGAGAGAGARGGGGGKSGKKGGKKDKDKPKPREPVGPPPEMIQESRLLEARRLACQGMVRLVTGLQVLGKLPAPALPFNGEEQRFHQRFGLLHVLETPVPMTYGQYLSAVDVRGVPQGELLRMSLECFHKSRQMAQLVRGEREKDLCARDDLVEEAKCLDKVAMINIIALQVLARPDVDGASNSITFDFSVHPHFPTCKVSAKGARSQQQHNL